MFRGLKNDVWSLLFSRQHGSGRTPNIRTNEPIPSQLATRERDLGLVSSVAEQQKGQDLTFVALVLLVVSSSDAAFLGFMSIHRSCEQILNAAIAPLIYWLEHTNVGERGECQHWLSFELLP